jgi:DNA-binding NarL/FixJ family response regulator
LNRRPPGATPSADRVSTLVEHGLTTREAEVLSWSLAGHSSTEVATTLGISPRTVAVAALLSNSPAVSADAHGWEG